MTKTILFLIAAIAPISSADVKRLICPTEAYDTSEWTTHDEGSFTVRLPTEYEDVVGYSIDSQVGYWRSGDSLVDYDFGYYSNKLVRDEDNPFPEMIVCQESGEGAPRVIVYRTEEGRSRLVAHWPGLARNGFGEIALTLGGSHPSADHLAQFLGIVKSVHFKASTR